MLQILLKEESVKSVLAGEREGARPGEGWAPERGGKGSWIFGEFLFGFGGG